MLPRFGIVSLHPRNIAFKPYASRLSSAIADLPKDPQSLLEITKGFYVLAPVAFYVSDSVQSLCFTLPILQLLKDWQGFLVVPHRFQVLSGSNRRIPQTKEANGYPFLIIEGQITSFRFFVVEMRLSEIPSHPGDFSQVLKAFRLRLSVSLFQGQSHGALYPFGAAKSARADEINRTQSRIDRSWFSGIETSCNGPLYVRKVFGKTRESYASSNGSYGFRLPGQSGVVVSGRNPFFLACCMMPADMVAHRRKKPESS
jgi:hypothetical protein